MHQDNLIVAIFKAHAQSSSVAANGTDAGDIVVVDLVEFSHPHTSGPPQFMRPPAPSGLTFDSQTEFSARSNAIPIWAAHQKRVMQ
jgi:hypothetical protein